MVLSQVVNGVVLPFVLIFMLLLTNDRELMGEHVNSRAVQHHRLDHRRRDDRVDAGDGRHAGEERRLMAREAALRHAPSDR